MWIDCNKKALAARQHFVLFVEDFGRIDVLSTAHAHFLGFHSQRLVQRDWLPVVHGNFGRQRNNVAQLVHFPHRLIEDGCDDAAVAMSGRAGVAFAETEAADKAVSFFVIGEAQAHAIRVIFAAGETVVLLQLNIAGIVPRFGTVLL